MKIFISADIEGISGITHRTQVVSGSVDYERGRRLMTQEVNAAIEGAIEGGADEVLVNDSHGSMRNIIIEELNPKARLITGFPKPLLMMEGIDKTFDGAVFIGYHSMAFGNGVLAHSVSGFTFSSIEINGVRFGETQLNAAVAGHFGVPVLAVSGDNCLREEIGKFLPNIEFAEVKIAHGNRTADCLNPVNSRILIKEKVKNAVLNKGKCTPFVVNEPIELKVGLNNPSIADVLQIIPGVERISSDKLVYNTDSIITAMNMVTTMMCASCILSSELQK